MDYSRLITTTSQKVAPFVVDAVHGSSVLVGRATARTKPWNMGIYERQPIQVAEVNTAISFRGMGNFNTADSSVDQNLQWEVKGFGDAVVIGWQELGLNQTQAQVINLVKRKFDVIKNALTSGLSTLLYGLGTGDEIEGLQLSTDAGTYSSTYGNLSRTTYGTYINGQVTAASGGVINFNSLAAQIDLCSAASSVIDSTNLLLTTKTVWGLIEKLVEAKSRGNYDTQRGNLRVTPYTPMGTAIEPKDVSVGMAGYESIYFRGIPAVKDDGCGSGLLYTLNERYLEFVSSPIAYCKPIQMRPEVTKGVYEEQPRDTAFQQTDEKSVPASLGSILQIAVSGNFVNRNPRRSGVLTGVTTT